MTSRAAVLAALLLVAAGCAPPVIVPTPSGPPMHDGVITSTRVGPVSIGMTARDLLATLGQPSRSIDSPRENDSTWDSPAISVVIRNDRQIVCEVSTTDSSFRTEEGVGVGSTQLEIRAALGAPRFQQFYAGGQMWAMTYLPSGYILRGATSDGRAQSVSIGFQDWCYR